MRIKKYPGVLLFASILVFIVWMPILNFWFNNVDLSYMHSYFDIIDPLGNINLLAVMRGHVMFHLPIYLLFGHDPTYYYLFGLLFHIICSVLAYKIVLLHTKNKTASLLSFLFFGINVVYVNVLFEGSFNLYYPVLLALLLFTHLHTLTAKRLDIRFVFLINTLFVFGLLIRETVFLLPFVYLLSVIFFKPLKQRKEYLSKVFVPMIAVCSLYILTRVFLLGDLKSDLTDDAVQFRSSLIGGGRWLELALAVLVNFFRITSEQIIPFPILYKIKDKLIYYFAIDASGSQSFSMIFPIAIGIGLVIVISFILWKLHKDKKLFKLGIFGLIWMFITNLFISSILPFPYHVLSQPYTYSTVLSRYNFYGFIGFVIFVTVLALKYKKILAILAIIVVYNLFAIRQGALLLQSKIHDPARNFFTQIKGSYPQFPNKAVVYYNFFQADRLKDFIGDLTYVFAKQDYPDTQFVLETTFSHIQSEVQLGNYEVDQVFAFDMDSNSNLIDKTEQVRQILVSSNSGVASKLAKVHLQGFVTKQSSVQCERYLSLYLSDKHAVKSKTKVSSSTSYGDYPRFYFISPDNLNDFQVNNNFYWQADVVDTNPFIILDLGEINKINGLGWVSEKDNHGLPRDYSILTSSDGENWNEVKQISGNTSASRIDYFQPTNTRFVKMTFSSTALGQPPFLLEVEALNYAEQIVSNFNSLTDLNNNAFGQSCDFILNDQRSYIPVKITTYTDSGASTQYNQILRADKSDDYYFDVLQIEPRSGSQRLLTEHWSDIKIEVPGSYKANWNIKEIIE